MRKRNKAISSIVGAVWGVVAAKMLCKMSEVTATFILYGGPKKWEIALCLAFIFVMCVSCVVFCYILDSLVGGIFVEQQDHEKARYRA